MTEKLSISSLFGIETAPSLYVSKPYTTIDEYISSFVSSRMDDAAYS